MNIRATMTQGTIENLLHVAHFEELLDSCKELLQEARSEGDRDSETMTLIGLAQAHKYLGKFYEARVYADGALKYAQELQDPEMMVMALNVSASLHLTAGYKVDEAEADYRAALHLAHENEATRGVAASLAGIAAVLNQMGENARAVNYAREAFEMARDEEDTLLMATTLGIMGNGFVWMQQPDKALKAFDDALALCEEDNIKLLKGPLMGGKGALLAEDERYFEEGVQLLEQAHIIAQDIRCVPHEFTALHRLGMVRRRAGQYDIAQDYYDTMLSRAQTWKCRPYEGMAFYELGRVHLYSEQYDESLANFEQALHISRETMNPFYEAQIEAALGMTCSLKRDYDSALSHFMAARTLYDALDDTPRMREMTQAIIFTYISRFVDGVLRFLGIRHEDSDAAQVQHDDDDTQ